MAYRNALEFLIRNDPEQRLDVRLPFRCFRALEDEAHKLYELLSAMVEASLTADSYPRIEYSSKDSTVTIITAQSGLHAKAAEILQRGIEDGVRRELTNCGRGDLVVRFGGVLDIRLNALDDHLRLYVKKPDGGLTYYKDGASVRLKTDLELWMGRFQCRSGILFSLKEKPGSAIQPKQNMSTYTANDILPFGDAMTQARLNQPFGPYRYNGHDWFGRLDTAFIEVFRRDQADPPQRTNVLENGQMLLLDLFPSGDESIRGIEAVLIHFDAARVQHLLVNGALLTAHVRFNDIVGHRQM
ncbi:hypothetical protein POJ06DRAFT_284594 [Lipomyces tetrasporus]|uniref:Uncharacterized protein n=1 Tax=Lipomyces tetrasporus TaxID=54092 RepID=A0AAD7QZ96_9ASCO|nr:uncharacterized protein POJ06DRAFT_284594 [Lipomyces tetrasporus]KAJ8103671.1 hypothetical protein POJ06DRAFT_284594 [Lipomyces tetrasporus]